MEKVKKYFIKLYWRLIHKYTSYCIVCQRDHKKDGTVWEYCSMCGKRHPHSNWKNRDNKWICGEYWRSRPTMAQKMANMSPQEILSGVHLGMDEQKGLFRDDAMREDWGKTHDRQKKELYETL